MLALPLANPTVDAVLITRDTAIRVTGNPDDSKRCRPRWSLAAVTAEAWGPERELGPTPDWVDGPAACDGVIFDREELGLTDQRGREFRVAATLLRFNGSIDGVLSRTPRGWKYEPSES